MKHTLQQHQHGELLMYLQLQNVIDRLQDVYKRQMYRFYEDNDLNIEIIEQDKEDLKNTVDYVSFSYYYTSNINSQSQGRFHNSHIKVTNDWGWGMDPLGLRIALNQYYDRYHLPIIISENGMGFYEKMNEDGTVPVSYTHLDVYKRQLLRCHSKNY